MRAHYLALTAVTLLIGAAWQEQEAVTNHPGGNAHIRAEAARLRAHFDAVDGELRAREIPELAADRGERRAQLIAWLREYRQAGEFPLNDRYADSATPIFRDADGTLCAMAYLIERSGRGDIVDRIARTRNTAYIHELTDDVELVAWLEEHGLGADEAARIQPAYGSYEPDEAEVSGDYVLASVALAGTSLFASYVNVTRATRMSGVLGLVAGVSTTAAGVLRLDEDGGTRNIALANSVIGVAAVGLALHGLRALRDDAEDSTGPVRVGGANLSVSPGIISVANRTRMGLRIQARF